MSSQRGFLSSLARSAPARDHIGLAASSHEAPVEAVKAQPSMLERLAARRRAEDTTLTRLARPL